MRIAFVDHTAQWGGAEVSMYQTMVSLDPRFDRLAIIGEHGELEERLVQAGIDTVVLQLPGTIRDARKDHLNDVTVVARVRALWMLARYVVRLAREMRRLGVDVVVTNSLKSDIYGGLAGRIARRPVVWWVRDVVEPPYLPQMTARVFRLFSLFVPTHIVCNSSASAHALGGTPTVIYPGIDIEAIEHASTQPGQSWFPHPYVLMIGRLAPWKGQDVLVEAAATLLPDHPDLHVILAGAALFGEDAYCSDLIDLVDRHEIQHRVLFVGHIDEPFRLLRDAKAVVHASVQPEPFGRVIAEAMALGRPVIASASGGPLEIITDGVDGAHFPPGDAAALASGVHRMLSDPHALAALSAAARRRARRFSTTTGTSEFECLLDGISGR